MLCCVCNRQIERKELINCSTCRHSHHIRCGNITTADYREHAEQLKRTWRCVSCVNSSRRSRNNDTPIRPTTITSPDKLSASNNGGFESSQVEHDISVLLSSVSTPSTPEQNISISYADFGKLLDSKLSVIEASLTKNIILNIKETIKSEINSAINQLKEDFTQTTDFLTAEQKDLKNNIKVTNDKLKTLETEKMQLQRELTEVGNRLRVLEKASRSCNLELHCIPEHKQENLLNIMRNICSTIGKPLLEQNISFARRVAKISTTTDRPRNVLVTFTSQSSRDSLIAAYKNYNKVHKEDPINSELLGISGRRQKIYIVEHLPPETKKLHTATREKLKNSYKYIWIKHGRVYVRKDEGSDAIHVSDFNNLLKLQ